MIYYKRLFMEKVKQLLVKPKLSRNSQSQIPKKMLLEPIFNGVEHIFSEHNGKEYYIKPAGRLKSGEVHTYKTELDIDKTQPCKIITVYTRNPEENCLYRKIIDDKSEEYRLLHDKFEEGLRANTVKTSKKKLDNATWWMSNEETGCATPFIETPYELSIEDTRKKAQKEIMVREGQKKFRNDAFKRYQHKCVVSGCNVQNVLQAGHIQGYKGKQTNHPANSIVLRVDLHWLYDANLMGIDTDFVIHIHPSVKDEHYRSFHGQKIEFIHPPSKEAHYLKWQNFLNKVV